MKELQTSDAWTLYSQYYRDFEDLAYITLPIDFKNYPNKNKNHKKGKKQKSKISRSNRRK